MDRYKSAVLICLALLSIMLTASAQTHTLTPWKGSAYRVAEEYLQAGYGPHVYEGDFINHVSFDALDIAYEPKDIAFPEVFERVRFGIVVRSKLEILEAGCYSLSLNSDDGSVLWLDNELAVSNDGHHKETRVTDSLVLDAKAYEAKVWYYNAYFGGYALELNINRIGTAEKCPVANLTAPPTEPIVVKGAQLFDQGEHTIPHRGAAKFDSLAARLKTMSIKKITIIGHTDDSGEEEDNQRLSERRAASVRSFLESRVNLTNVEVVTLGKGESEPIADNSTRAGKATNRRVEILVE